MTGLPFSSVVLQASLISFPPKTWIQRRMREKGRILIKCN